MDLNTVFTAIAASSAVVAAISAIYSYKLSKNIYDEIKSDETIIAGELHHPGLAERDHDNCVLRCTLFNKSKRKAYINSVKAYEKNGQEIDITWSDAIDNLGNILNPTGLLGLENSINLLLRRNDGNRFTENTIIVKHSFSKNDIEIAFNTYED